MAKQRAKKPKFRKIELSATVLPAREGPAYLCPQDEMCQMFGVSDRTLREWHRKGLPKETDAQGRPVYPFPAANIWAGCYTTLVATTPYRKGPPRLTVEEAYDWDLQRQHRMGDAEFVLVPLHWDHPAREQQLRRAAAGLEPPPEDEL